jgi:glycosyltransferase involved in cell wall biosynthesis
MSFSVIIPVFNREAYIGEAIASAINQELPAKKIIVVDDGSTDRTVDIVRGFGDRILLLRQDHRGCAAARNLAAKHAVGEYLAFLDSDDLWFPWTLSTVAKVIETANNPAMLRMALRHFVLSPPEVPERSAVEWTYHNDMLSQPAMVGTCQLVARRDVFEICQGFVEINMNGTDAEFNLRAGVDYPFVDITQPDLVAYRDHDSNVMKNFDGTYRGQQYMIDQERRGIYPGGPHRQKDRRMFITRHTRSFSLLASKHKRSDLAWNIFKRTFYWNLQEKRLRYLFAFPLILAFNFLKGCMLRRIPATNSPTTCSHVHSDNGN